MGIIELIEKVKELPDCKVYPPIGLPKLHCNNILPKDLLEFYENCGGMTLYSSQDYVTHIVPPEKFQQANPIIVGELCEEDISSNWYTIVDDGNGDYLTIDLDIKRSGRCYDSFWDRHGVVGECQIIALSFTDLLDKLISNKGKYWYWLRDGYTSIGDAYDDI